MTGTSDRGGFRRRRLVAACLAVAVVLGLPAAGFAAVTSGVAVGILTVASDADDDIAIFCDAGNVKISVNGGAGADPDSGPEPCAAISTIDVTGGPGANEIDLSGVTAADFTAPGGITVTVNASDGTDDVTGSAFDDTLSGGLGQDFLTGGPAGDDDLNGGGDADNFFVALGTAGRTTTVSGGAGAAFGDSLQVSGTGGNDNITLTDAAITMGTETVNHSTVEMLWAQGLNGDDTLDGSLATLQLNLVGDDFGAGPHGNDTLTGGDGPDFLQSRGGTDTLEGGGDGDSFSAAFTGSLALNPTDVTVTDGGGAPSAPCPGPFECPEVTNQDLLEVLGTAGDDAGANQLQITDGGVLRDTGLGVMEEVTHANVERVSVSGMDGNDSLNATAATAAMNHALFGDNGDDTLNDGSGNSFLSGDLFYTLGCGLCGVPGDDTLDGGPGIDLLSVNGGADTLQGGPAAVEDFFTVSFTGDGANPTTATIACADPPLCLLPPVDLLTVVGTPGNDTVTLTDTQAARAASLETVDYTTNIGTRRLDGSNGDDTLNASAVTASGVQLFGGPDNDDLTGSPQGDDLHGGFEGDDDLFGGNGDDDLTTVHGVDNLDGQEGQDDYNVDLGDSITATVDDTGAGFEVDNLFVHGTDGDDTITISSANDITANGPATVDVTNVNTDPADPEGIEEWFVFGMAGDDSVNGSQGTNDLNLNGDGDSDTVTGGDGSDIVTGDGGPPGSVIGNDTLAGGEADDVIVSAGGADSADGNNGDDVVVGILGPAQDLTADDTGDPSNTDEFNSQGTAGPDTITVTNPQITNGVGQTQTLSGFEEVFVNGGPGADTLNAAAYPYGLFLDGGPESDILTGGTGPDFLNGGDGGDTMDGGFGPDNFFDFGVGPGDDTVTYAGRVLPVQVTQDNPISGDGQAGEGDDVGGGIETIVGGLKSDTLVGGFGPNTLDGGPGNDTLNGGLGTAPDDLIGGPGTDTGTYATRSDGVNVTLDGLLTDNDGAPGEGDNVDTENVSGGTGNDTLTGSGATNELVGNGGVDILNGAAGNDALTGGSGADTVHGGLGTDIAIYTGGIAVNVTLDGAANDGQAGENDNVGPAGDVENVQGGGGADTITGNAGANTLLGGGGGDTLNGGAGNDLLFGQAGVDTLNGGTNKDGLDGGTQADVLNGDGGVDAAVYDTRIAFVSLTIDGVANDGEVGEGDDIAGTVEDLTGGAGNDILTGNAAANTLDGGPGADTMSGGGGVDTVSYALRTALQPVIVTIDGAANDGGAIDGGATDNVGTDIENVNGGAGDDDITGSDLANILRGNAGADKLTGLLGLDQLLGGNGNDDLHSDDTVAGDANNCGGGTDTVTRDVGDTVTGDCEFVTP